MPRPRPRSEIPSAAARAPSCACLANFAQSAALRRSLWPTNQRPDLRPAGRFGSNRSGSGDELSNSLRNDYPRGPESSRTNPSQVRHCTPPRWRPGVAASSKRFSVSKSRKLLLAAALLGGGYGLALVLSQAADLLTARPTSVASTPRSDGWWAALQAWVPRHQDATSQGKLVPESQYESQLSTGFLPPVRRDANEPTWLAASTEPGSQAAIASPPIAPPAPGRFPDSVSAIETAVQLPGDPLPARQSPRARPTNVVTRADDPASRRDSAWDRWPRWNDDRTDAVRATVPATFQDTSVASASGGRSIARRSDLGCENSPPPKLDPAELQGSRTHIVIDGDSLKSLAERYLDDPDLDDEIFRLNRDVLARPDLLPIGVELRIPDRRTADSTTGFAATAVQSGAPKGMVPVPRSPRGFDDPPRAELLRPVSALRSD
jgi:hypothetical protein